MHKRSDGNWYRWDGLKWIGPLDRATVQRELAKAA